MDTTPWDYGLTPGSSPWHTAQPDGANDKNCGTLATYCDLYENTGPVEFAVDNCQGTVSIPDTFGMSFDFTIDTWSDTHGYGYIHLFDINEPASGMIAFRYGRWDESPYNGTYLLYFKFALSGNPVILDSFTIDRSGNDDGKTFHLEALVTQTTAVISIDGMVVSDTTKLPHEALTDVPICFATERTKPGRIADFRIYQNCKANGDLYENTGPIEIAVNNCQHTVSIPDAFRMSFDFTIDSWDNEFIYLFDINYGGSGEIAFRYGRSWYLYFKFNAGNLIPLYSFSIDPANDDGRTFHLEALVTQTTVMISIDGTVVSDTTKLPHETHTQTNMFRGGDRV
eukprot:352640_1